MNDNPTNDIISNTKDDTNRDMANGPNYTERAYVTNEVATMLGMAVPTVRKYSQHLEKEGYSFAKGKVTGKQQARLFTDKDIIALRYFKELRTESNIKVEQAASLIINKFGKGSIQDIGSSDIPEIMQYKEQYNEPYNELKELIQQQNELIRGLTERLDHQQDYIDKSLKGRDQALLQAIDERLEARKQIAAAEANEDQAEQKEQPKSWIARLFGK